MSLSRDQAIVLRTLKLGEADRIITLLTKEHGRIRAVAKGVRRTKSKFGARLEPGSMVEIQLYSPPAGKKGMEIVTQAESISNYGEEIAQDYQSWTVLHAMIEAVEKLTNNEYEKSVEQFNLFSNALAALAQKRYETTLILDAYLLRALSLAGFAPALKNCSVCEKPGPHKYFSLSGGGLICGDCKTSAAANVSQPTLELLQSLISGDWEVAKEISPRYRTEGSGLIAAYLQWHLEHGLKTLSHVERK